MNKLTKEWFITEFWWFIHNMVAHPLHQVLHMVGWIIPPFQEWADWVHDITVPNDYK